MLWFFGFAYLFYSYHFNKGILWFFMYPNWILILNMVIGIFGTVISFILVQGKLMLKTCLLIDLPILIFGFFLTHLIVIF